MKHYQLASALLALAAAFVACGTEKTNSSIPVFTGNGSTITGTATATPTSKPLASNWTVSSGSWTMNWSGFTALGTEFSSYATESSGAICVCAVTLTGTAASGACAVSAGSYVGAGTGDPGCAGNPTATCGVSAGTGTGSFISTGTTLVFGNGDTYN
jgi:hypothetical protein